MLASSGKLPYQWYHWLGWTLNYSCDESCERDYHVIAAVSSGRIWVWKICIWVGCWGWENTRKVWVWVYCACIWTQPGIWVYWPALSRGWGCRDESLYILKFLSFWAFQLPRMHQFLKWDFNLQYFSPFNEDFFFLYFSLFASYVKPLAVHILSLWVLNPFLYFVSFCLSLCGNNHGIWEFDLEVALCLSVCVQWLRGAVTPLCSWFSKGRGSAGGWEWCWLPASTGAALQGCAVCSCGLELVFRTALSSAVQ